MCNEFFQLADFDVGRLDPGPFSARAKKPAALAREACGPNRCIGGYKKVQRRPQGSAISKQLERIFSRWKSGLVLNFAIVGRGPEVYQAACRMGLEGIVSKRVDAPYRSGRSKAWLKIKNLAAPGILLFKRGDIAPLRAGAGRAGGGRALGEEFSRPQKSWHSSFQPDERGLTFGGGPSQGRAIWLTATSINS